MRFNVVPRSALVALLIPTGSYAPAAVVGIGVMGDSVADEYQFPIFQPVGGDRRDAKNFVELLASDRGLNFGAFSLTSRGSPRNEGYEYNWAEDGSRTADLLAKGQHTGLAAQVAAGKVDLAWMFIGANDFRDLFNPEVITSPDPGAAIQSTVVNTLTNVLTAAQTVLAANPNARAVIANVPDIESLPELRFALAQQPQLAPFVGAVVSGIEAYNAQLKSFADSNDRVAVIDAFGFLKQSTSEPLVIDGLAIKTTTPGSYNHFFIDAIHPGTVAQGLLANRFIEASNSEFGAGLVPLSASEIREAAIPLPPAIYGGIACMAMLGIRIARRTLAA